MLSAKGTAVVSGGGASPNRHRTLLSPRPVLFVNYGVPILPVPLPVEWQQGDIAVADPPTLGDNYRAYRAPIGSVVAGEQLDRGGVVLGVPLSEQINIQTVMVIVSGSLE
jgi:hypothetical protein